MRQSRFVLLLAAEALLCLLLYGVGAEHPTWFSTAMAFPFQQIGNVLRILSISGSVGNGVAIALYVLLSLLPLACLFFIKRRRKLEGEDCLLPFLSVLCFAALYYAVNPGLLPAPSWADVSDQLYQGLFGGAVYAHLLCYLSFRALRLFAGEGRRRLQDYLSILLRVLAVCFVFLAFGGCFHGYLSEVDALKGGNTGDLNHLGASVGFIALRWLNTALAYILDVVVILAALELIYALKTDRYAEKAMQAAEKLSSLCVLSLKITLLATVFLNLLQLMLLKLLRTVHIQVSVPVLSVAFVLAVLLLARFVAENRQLKADTDLFI